MFNLEDLKDPSSFYKAISRDQEGVPLKTTQSVDKDPKLSLVTYDYAQAMQGMATYKPSGYTYDVFNRELSSELEGLGAEVRWTSRDDKLLPYDVFLADPDPATAGGSMGGVSVAPSSGGGGAVAPLTGGSNEAFAVGDSITVGCQSYLEQNDKGWKFTVDARVSRPTPEGIDHIKSRNGTFGSVVVVNLGTNGGGPPYAQQAAEIEQLLSSVPRIVWVTVNELSDWQRSVNVEIHNIATRNNRVVIVDWASIIAGNPGLKAGDGIHATPDGYKRLSTEILNAMGPAPK